MTEHYDHAVIVVHTENYVHPQGWIAQIEIDDDTPVVIATSSVRKSILEGSQAVHDADISMWKYIANTAMHSLLRGCRTLALPLFIGACIFKNVFVGAGFPVANTNNLYHDADDNILNVAKASECLSQSDPFCLWISYPDVDPSSDVTSWVQTAAVNHISAGRVAVLDRRWQSLFEKYNISDELESTVDPLATEGEEFSFAWSYQYGSNSGRILSTLETSSNASHQFGYRPPALAE